MLRRPLLPFFARRDGANRGGAVSQVPEGIRTGLKVRRSFWCFEASGRTDRVRFLRKERTNAG